jgi:hypothetical protein
MPDPITWDQLCRAIGDLETIQEAIDAAVLTHNLDASAHGQSDESVYNHRIADSLDHVFGSVDLRHLTAERYSILTAFESLDGWQIVGAVTQRILNTYLQTGASNGNKVAMYINDEDYSPVIDFTKNPFFQATMWMYDDTYLDVYMVAGMAGYTSDGDYFGFKIHNATLYAVWKKGATEYTQEITGIDTMVKNTYRAFMNTTDGNIVFYVNGVLKYTATTNLPTTGGQEYFTFHIKTNQNAAKRMYLVDFLFEQER